MRRKLLIAVLGLGTVLGYAQGFSSMSRCHKSRQQSFEQHVAAVCVNAAKRGEAPPDQERGHHGCRGWGHQEPPIGDTAPNLRDPFAPPPQPAAAP